MISSKPSILLLLLLVLISGALSAQDDKFNRFSAEVTGGMHFPLSPDDGITTSDYADFKQFQVSGRYMFTEAYGIKGHYAHNSIFNKNNSNLGISYNRMGIEGVANIGKILNVGSTRRIFGVLAHTGVGITFANPMSGKMERIGNFMIGITPEVKLTNSFTLLGDVTYAGNFRQHYAYNGSLFPDRQYRSGSVMNLSIGIMYSLGSKDIHADWY